MRLPYCKVIAILQGDCIEEILKLSVLGGKRVHDMAPLIQNKMHNFIPSHDLQGKQDCKTNNYRGELFANYSTRSELFHVIALFE